MAWCLTAPRHCLNQCWLSFVKFIWYSPKRNFAASGQVINLRNKFEIYTFEITATSVRCQWINMVLREKNSTNRIWFVTHLLWDPLTHTSICEQENGLAPYKCQPLSMIIKCYDPLNPYEKISVEYKSHFNKNTFENVCKIGHILSIPFSISNITESHYIDLLSNCKHTPKDLLALGLKG